MVATTFSAGEGGSGSNTGGSGGIAGQGEGGTVNGTGCYVADVIPSCGNLWLCPIGTIPPGVTCKTDGQDVGGGQWEFCCT